MPSRNYLILPIPNETVERQQASGDVQHRPRRLLGRAGVHDRDTAVVSGKGEGIAARGKADTLDPASRVIQEFSTDGVEGEALSPGTRLRAGVNALDEARENPCVRVSGASSQQHRVGMPRQRRYGAPNGLL